MYKCTTSASKKARSRRLTLLLCFLSFTEAKVIKKSEREVHLAVAVVLILSLHLDYNNGSLHWRFQFSVKSLPTQVLHCLCVLCVQADRLEVNGVIQKQRQTSKSSNTENINAFFRAFASLSCRFSENMLHWYHRYYCTALLSHILSSSSLALSVPSLLLCYVLVIQFKRKEMTQWLMLLQRAFFCFFSILSSSLLVLLEGLWFSSALVHAFHSYSLVDFYHLTVFSTHIKLSSSLQTGQPAPDFRLKRTHSANAELTLWRYVIKEHHQWKKRQQLKEK